MRGKQSNDARTSDSDCLSYDFFCFFSYLKVFPIQKEEEEEEELDFII